MMAGQHAQCRISMTISLRLNPRDPMSPMAAGGIPASYYVEGNYQKAVEAARQCLADYPAYAPPRRWLVAALGNWDGRTKPLPRCTISRRSRHIRLTRGYTIGPLYIM